MLIQIGSFSNPLSNHNFFFNEQKEMKWIKSTLSLDNKTLKSIKYVHFIRPVILESVDKLKAINSNWNTCSNQ